MPNLLSRSKHVEFEWNSGLQIRNQKERRSKRGAEEGQKSMSNFAPLCEIFSCIFDFLSFLLPFSHFFSLHVYKCELRVFLYFSYESFI